MKDPCCTNRITARWFAAVLLIIPFLIPIQAQAQIPGCAGAVNIGTDGQNWAGGLWADFYYGDLLNAPAPVRYSINPRSGGTLDVNTDSVNFGLTCFNNGKDAPCLQNDEQLGTPNVTPITYVGNVSEDCEGTVDVDTNTDGLVTFIFQEIALDTTGCTISFDTLLNDVGIDATPGVVSSSVQFDGDCGENTDGGAEGSANVEVYDPVIEVTKTGETLAKPGDDIDYTISFTVLESPITKRVDEDALGECRLVDPLLGVDQVVLPNTNYNFTYSVPDDATGSIVNIATVTCGALGGSALTFVDDDTWTVPLIDPQIQASKTGPGIAKAGDSITYTIGCSATNDPQYLDVCTANDPLLGGDLGVFNCAAGESRDFPYTVPDDATGSVDNTVKFTCDIVDRDNKAEAEASHSVTLIAPAIKATKEGPTDAKAGDSITYTIGCSCDTDCDSLDVCTANDPLLGGDLGVFDCANGESRDFPYTVPDDASPDVDIDNEVTFTCGIKGRGNTAQAKAQWSVDVYEVGGELTKTCDPLQIPVGEAINWEICVQNTGEKVITCDVTDTKAFTGTKQLGPIDPQGKACLQESRDTNGDDVPSITNEAKATCVPPRVDNTFELGPKEATCEVIKVDELCRTPGFWKTHAGTEKDGRSSNLTQIVIDSAPGETLGNICGVEIDNTSVAGYDGAGSYPGDGTMSAVEGMCVHPKTKIVRQLQRQLIAASLNCVVSGGTADCTGLLVDKVWKDANQACKDEADDMSDWIEKIDAFNNGLPPYNCEETIQDSPVFDDVAKVPGPAGSSRACNAATYNTFYLVPTP